MRAALGVSLAWSVVLLVGSCSRKSNQGLPPAEGWDQNSLAGVAPIDRGPRAQGVDPHAGVPGAPPLGPGDDGEGDVENPHGDMGGMGMGEANPHAGGVDVTQLGIEGPDPNRKIDPSRRIKGTIRVHAKAKSRVTANGAVFVVVKRAGADGQPTGMPLAVEKLAWAGDALPFELTEANAMAAGTELSGDVVVSARFDQDSEAISKQPGDVTGQVRVKIPADKVELTLDTVLP